MVILVGSWITHTTTATVYDDFRGHRVMPFKSSVAADPGDADSLAVDIPGEPVEITAEPALLKQALLKDEPASMPASAIDATEASTKPLDKTIYTIRRGDTLGGIFKKLDFDLSLPQLIGQHPVGKQLVSLTIGKQLVFATNQQQQLTQIDYPVTALRQLIIDLQGREIVNAEVATLAYRTDHRSVSGEISSSLYEAALEAGLSNAMVMELVRIFGWDIDFVLDIRKGDNFHVIYEEHNLDGTKLSDGSILAAEFTTQNQTYRAIRFDDGEDGFSYYNPQGESMLGTFLRSPVEFSRISSRFGNRKHPILKTWRKHQGVDYAASRGTPIRATADGKVIHAGRKGGYGNAIVLRHAGRFSTLYGHMNGFAKSIHNGSRVKQGDIIGYIGSSGLATGPHLHYEFRLDGVHRNPLTFKTPKATAISAEMRPAFDQATNQWMARLNSVTGAYRLAQQLNEQPGKRAKSGSLAL